MKTKTKLDTLSGGENEAWKAEAGRSGEKQERLENCGGKRQLNEFYVCAERKVRAEKSLFEKANCIRE